MFLASNFVPTAAERQCTDWCVPSIFNRAEPVEPGEEEAVPCDPRPEDPPKVPPGVDCSDCWYAFFKFRLRLRDSHTILT